MKIGIGILVGLGILALFLYAGGLNYFRSWTRSSPPDRIAGMLVADEAMVSAKIGGRVRELLVEEGSRVKANQVLAVLDSAEIDAERENQIARIDQIESKLRRSEEVVALEERRNGMRTERSLAAVQVARSQRDQKLVERDQNKADLERTRQLFQRGLVAREEFEQAQTAVNVDDAALKALADRVAEATADLEVSRAEEGQIRVLKTDVEERRAELVQSRAALKQIEVRLADASIRSPIPGVVSRRILRAGEVVQPGAPIVVVVDPDDLWVKAEIEETFVHELVLGQSLTVEVPGVGTVVGTLTFIAPEAEFATQRDVSRVKRDIRTFGIKVAIPNPERRLHPGVSAYVRLAGPGTDGRGSAVESPEAAAVGTEVEKAASGAQPR